MTSRADRIAQKAKAAKGYMQPKIPRVHHIPKSVVWSALLAPWIMCVTFWGAVHFGIIYPQDDFRAEFCALASKTPDRIMCSNPNNCSIEALYLTGTSMQQNRLMVGTCGGSVRDAPMYLPVDMLSPDEATLAEMRAQIGAMTRAQRRAMFEDWEESRGGPE